MLTYPAGESRSKTLNAAFTCAGVYDVLTFRDITVTNSAARDSAGCVSRGEAGTGGRAGGVGVGRRTVKVDLSVAIRVDLVDHLVELLLRTRGARACTRDP